MAKFFVKRILTAIVQIFVVTTIVFFALQMMPGDPVLMMLSRDGSAGNQEAYDAQEAELGVEITQRLDNQIHQSILSYRSALEAGRFQDAEEQGETLRSQVLKRDYSVSGDEDLTTQLQELQSQLRTLQSQAAGSVRRITAPAAGLYSAVVDGYETVLTPESLTDLTPSALESVTADASVQSNVGKLVLGETWYLSLIHI